VKPRDLDVVRLLRPLPEHDLPAGSEGTVVNDYQRHDVPNAYLVEFADSDGVTQALVTIAEEDLEVVWRPDAGSKPS
jgi:hypothetical protein